MEEQPSHVPPFEPIVQMRSPRVYGSFPTLFGMPLAETEEDLRGADVAFLGVPWRAPTTPSSFFVGGARANFEGTQLTPSYFRLNSLNYGGYLPELDLDVFEHLRLADRGDADVFQDVERTFSAVEAEVGAMVDAGCIPLVMGGNAGPTTYPVLKAIAERAAGPTAVLNLDAHGDDQTGGWEDDLAQRILDSAAKVWIALDPDVLNLDSTPDFGAEPLGPTIDEVIELVYRVGRAAGQGKFGGVSLMAIPHQAQSLHQTMIYVLLYALAGVLSSKA